MTARAPTGTFTFLFSDLEGSTRMWAEHAASMQEALKVHDALLRDAVEAHDGVVVKSTGDGLLAVFIDPVDAIDAAATGQRVLTTTTWPEATPLRVRMALHAGAAEQRDGDYFGAAVNRAARLTAIGHGGQILVSEAVVALTRDRPLERLRLVDLGAHRLRDLSEPERVFQLAGHALRDDFPPLRSLDERATNLPVQLTSFVGRAGDVAHVEKLLAEHRLVTLVGVGGVGKTRLATHVAAEVLPSFADGVWFVDLSSADGARVPEAIAREMRVDLPANIAVETTLVDSLRNRSLLLALDNCEHLLREARRVVDLLLREAPGVRVLATSREALRAPGEHVVTVASLDDAGARELFVERALAADSGFGEAGSPAIDDLCRRLDGIPLAIELAAARVRMLSVDELARRVEQRFRVLTGGRGDLERHQTLRAAIDWSYDLLDDRERRAFARLSVFAGGGTLDAVETIVGDDAIESDEVLDLVASLVDKSLVVVDREHAASRYTMLETIRQYAAERLVGGPDAEATRNRHAGFYAELARQAGRGLYSPDAETWFDRLAPELDNLQVAVSWAAATGLTEEAMRIGGSFARQASRPELGTVHFAEAALVVDGFDGHPLRARVLAEAGWAAIIRGDMDTGRARLERAVAEIAQGARHTAAPHTYLLTIASAEGDGEDAYRLATEGLAAAEAAGDAIASTALRASKAMYTFYLGHSDEARNEADRALADARRLGIAVLETVALQAVAYANSENDVDRAIAALELAHEISDRHHITSENGSRWQMHAFLVGRQGDAARAREVAIGMLRALSGPLDFGYDALGLGSSVIASAGRPDLAARCLGAAAPRYTIAWPRMLEYQQEERARVRAILGDERYEQECAMGAQLGVDAVVAQALAELESTAP